MYLLCEIEFPERRLARSQVENAWTGAGLPQPVPRFEAADVPPDVIRGVVLEALKAAGATKTSDANGDLEVPRSSGGTLAKLEEFYHRLYPETRASTARGHFHYEELEWLGEF